jgi:phytanoyl-CoA hydroxylase
LEGPIPLRSKHGERGTICAEQKRDFHEKGYVVVPNVLTEAEMQWLDRETDDLYQGRVAIPGRDFCDMSQPLNVPFEKFRIVNAMLPRKYKPVLQNNVYERVSASIVAQLFAGTPMTLDYDQLLDKRPREPEARFAMHQDLAYWPPASFYGDTRTATFSLALDSTTKENGAIQFVVGSHKAQKVRPHKAAGANREDNHAISAPVYPDEKIEYAIVPRGGVSIHNEYIVHGSAGNLTDGRRRTYVIAYRTAEMVRKERAIGFTHSHEDKVNWDTFNTWLDEKERKDRA